MLVLLLLTAVGVAVLVLLQIVEDLIGFLAALPAYIREAADAVGVDVNTAPIEDSLATTRNALVEFGGHLLNGIVQATAGLASVIGEVFTVGLIAFYLVAEGPWFRRAICSVLPRERAARGASGVGDLDREEGDLYSRLVLAVVSGAGVYVVLRLLGLPYASSLAIWQGFISAFVPIIGSYIALALPLLASSRAARQRRSCSRSTRTGTSSSRTMSCRHACRRSGCGCTRLSPSSSP